MSGVGMDVWSLIAFTIHPDESPWSLLSDTMAATCTTLAYVWRHNILLLSALPWKLADGDIAMNLQRFAATPRPLDVSSQKCGIASSSTNVSMMWLPV